MEQTKLEAKLEALLFLQGAPIKIKKLSDILGVKQNDINNAVDKLSESLKDGDGGLILITHDDNIQLTTKSEFGDLLKEIAKEELDTDLSPASMETLSIVAYLGPCRRNFVDHIRGVNSSYILRSLLVRGLIERGQDKKRANTFTYNVTLDFLRHMGIDKVEELPDYEKYREFINKFIGEDGESNT